MYRVLVAEPVYHGLPPIVYHNRIRFWMEATTVGLTLLPPKENGPPLDIMAMARIQAPLYKARPYTIGPRENIRMGRDRAICEAMGEGATHVLFMDDDMLVPPDILQRLLEVDKPIVGGLTHRDNGDPLVWRAITEGDDSAALSIYAGYDVEEVSWKDHPKTEAFECAAIAAGCMLIQVDVFKELKKAEPLRWLFNYDETSRSMDVNFCRSARAAGFTVWCWPGRPCIQIKHYD